MLLRKKILIVEDSDIYANAIQTLLINSHCLFEVAGNMEEASFRITSFEPEIIILDVGMPRSKYDSVEVSFAEILSFIRSAREKSAVVILTGNVDPDQAEQAMAAGARDYLSKIKMTNRVEFESRIAEAYRLQVATMANEATAVLALGQATTRAMIETMRATLDNILKKLSISTMQTSELQSKKDELLKKQVWEAAVKANNAKWRKWVWGVFVSIFWFIVWGIKTFFGKLTLKH